MDSRRRQRSIALNHIPPLLIPHGLEYPLGFWMHLVFIHLRLEASGETVSTFPRVPLTREPTCTQAINPGASRAALTSAATSRPSRSSGHFPDFPWSGSLWLAHGSPLHGNWFPNFMGLLLGAFCHPSVCALICSLPRDVLFPFVISRQRPNRRVPWFPVPKELLCGPWRSPFLPPSPHPIPHPVFMAHPAASNSVGRAC